MTAAVLFTGGMLLYRGAEQVFYNQPIYQGSPRFKEIAFTVNVFWGEEYIPQMLDILRQNNVKATFFLGGTWVKKYPELASRIAGEGHEIGSHGYSHPHPDRLSKSENLREMQKAEDIIYRATGVRPRLFAPPYGERGPSVLEAADDASYTTILWSIDTLDWQLPPPDVVVQRVTSRAHNGAIVLMHPTAPTVKALPEIIQKLKKEGYQLVTVSKLLEGVISADGSVQGLKIRI
ncbi:MAG: polysaccharide deacetylase family protein [Peptococcaceae bacterium]|nr:polysaccharide deacetylase family protein [Peptococcaceae bacterium]